MLRAIIFIVAAICTHLVSPLAYSSEATVDKVVITNTPDNTWVSFEIKNAFTKDIEEGIKSGIPTTFTFFVELYRRRGIWFDEQLHSITFKHTIKYDTLKEEYEIMMEEKPQVEADSKSVPIIRVKEIEQAKKIMASGEDILVKPASALEKGEKYQLRIKAMLDPVNLPFPLNYMLFFVSFWDYETSWYEKEFIP
jgi:hypothetical protein